jgi:hypothetical protein
MQIKFTIPAPQSSPFLFKRALFAAIRASISKAHADGALDAETAVACLRALPEPQP